MNHHFNSDLYVRPLFSGLGEAVARRTFLRENETWGDVASRVALGNALLHPTGKSDLLALEKHIASGLLLMSGRHLQHGDVTQPGRNLEVFSNCSSAATSSMKFYLLLNGSGVGRCYDDDIMIIDWSKLPKIDLILDHHHPDFVNNEFVKPVGHSKTEIYDEYYRVADSREGWGKAVELLEYLAYDGWSQLDVALDFSGVRAKGSPIKGMQNRPSAGPIPTMHAIYSIMQMAQKAKLNPEEWPLWKQNLYVDHYLADCVHLGGARRAARIAVKYWRDKGILEYCRIKQNGGLWSANMSVGVDQDYYDALVNKSHPEHDWAMSVANAIVDGQIHDKTGEPGTVNLHRLTSEEEGLLTTIDDIGSAAYPLSSNLKSMYKAIAAKLLNKKWKFITNPCVPGRNKVLTPSGITSIKKINVGDTIWTGKRWTTVINKMNNGIKKVFKYRTTSGFFESTRNHRIVENGLKIDIVKAKSIDISTGVSDKTKLLLSNIVMDGLVLGDGMVHKASNDLVLLCVGKNDTEYFSSEVSSLIGVLRNGINCCAYEIVTDIKSAELPRTWLREIPDRYFYGDEVTVRSFLRGLFSANGSVVDNRVTLKSSSLKLIEQVQVMLSSIGISSYYTNNRPKKVQFENGEYVCKESWDLNITSHRKKFIELIGFIQEYKNNKVTSICRKAKTTANIVSEEYVGEETVYDITVDDPEHVYWCNGFLSSNCGEIVLSILGGFCVIADVALGCAQTLNYIKDDLKLYPSYRDYLESGGTADWDEYDARLFWNQQLKKEIIDAVKCTVRALIRTNLLPSVYDGEVKRTNRIGASLTGIHEFAWLAYGYGFRDLLNEEYSKPFWDFISYLRTVVSVEAKRYSEELGVVCPHTDTTIKPSGSVSKVFGLTEGGHLLAMRYFLRWVQFQKEDPLAADYEAAGYPCLKDLKGYEHVIIVGFPTAPYISTLGMGDKLVTAAEATPLEQFQWLRLLEKHWIVGQDSDGNPLKDRGNQISYTLKFDPSVTDRDEFFNILWGNQNTVKCCSVMPQADMTAYAYQPEQPISKAEFDSIVSRITSKQETVTLDALQCASGACPI